MTSRQQTNWPYVPFGVEQIDTLKITKAEGSYLYTVDGQKILDASAGAIVGNIGWGRAEVAEAAAEAMTGKGYILPPFWTEEREQLVAILREHWLPGDLSKVSFMGSGSEAVDNAVRLARQYQLAKGRPSRWKVVGRDISYHGTSLAGLSVGGHAGRRREFEPMLMDVPHAAACYCLRCPFGKQPAQCAYECADDLEVIIEREGADTIAAFIAEPIVGASGGVLVPPDGYWPKIASICNKHDILFIADEVMTGFGRTGKKFAVEHWDVTPDILVLGKGLSGGYATVSAVATSDAFCQQLIDAGTQPMYHTYGAHPAACAASAKVLEIMQREKLLERVADMSAYFEKSMAQLQKHPHVAEVRGKGFFYALEIVKNRDTLEHYPQENSIALQLVQACLKRDCFVYFGGTGVVRDIIMIAPHFTIKKAEIDVIVSIVKEALDEVCLKDAKVL